MPEVLRPRAFQQGLPKTAQQCHRQLQIRGPQRKAREAGTRESGLESRCPAEGQPGETWAQFHHIFPLEKKKP